MSEHAIWATLEATWPTITQAEGRDAIEGQEQDALSRLRMLLSLIGQRLSAVDREVASMAVVDQMTAQLASVNTQTGQFVLNGDPQHLRYANDNADAAMGFLAQLHVPQSTDDLQGLGAAAAEYRDRLDGILQIERAASEERLSQMSESLSTQIGALRVLAAEKMQEVATSVAEARAQLVALETKANELAAIITSEKARTDTAVAEFQAQFSAAQEARSKDHIEAQSTRQQRFDDTLRDYGEHLASTVDRLQKDGATAQSAHDAAMGTLNTQFGERATKLLTSMEAEKTRVEGLVGVIGDLAVTSGHKTEADDAKKNVEQWHKIAISSMTGLVVVALITLFTPIFSGSFSWPALAARLYVSVALGVLAAYAANQASRYQEIERRNRKLELDLKAVGPFVQSLDTKEQQQIRMTLADRSFGRDDMHEPEPGPATLLHVLNSKDGREFIADLVKRILAKDT